ncbi:hypothetical protein RRG08_023204 [Elysia crispata]|uniref:Secreted protein n=1 Tax=Elysia crispata TaxID=231223 RepID=A0AAE0ZPP1_9GAST|nr:hypothetical protein RRG08_023204 [Elysia crispata]
MIGPPVTLRKLPLLPVLFLLPFYSFIPPEPTSRTNSWLPWYGQHSVILSSHLSSDSWLPKHAEGSEPVSWSLHPGSDESPDSRSGKPP